MSQLLHHRGLQGTVQYSAEDKVLHGRVLGIRGLVSYEGESIVELESDFCAGVDDYLAGVASGSLSGETASQDVVISFSHALHERALQLAELHNEQLSDVVVRAVSRFVEEAA